MEFTGFVKSYIKLIHIEEAVRARNWAMLCQREDLLKKTNLNLSRLCSVHFETTMFSNKTRSRLCKNAVPSLFPSIEDSPNQHSNIDQVSQLDVGRQIKQSGCHPENEEGPSTSTSGNITSDKISFGPDVNMLFLSSDEYIPETSVS
ncbi:unnamed protein product [Diabrotica balteata]|uniref:THAP-type domain-containing protein n=1 Tax=Diabrotica balteata TaxID=107213 RepID=A0A9N9XJM0_DIABA|nr:unnamed protein product [Diabrotica balteata]